MRIPHNRLCADRFFPGRRPQLSNVHPAAVPSQSEMERAQRNSDLSPRSVRIGNPGRRTDQISDGNRILRVDIKIYGNRCRTGIEFCRAASACFPGTFERALAPADRKNR